MYIVSAPSGSGKTTLVQHLIRNFEDLTFSVSYTTRSPRAGEANHVDYFFVDRAEFKAMVEGGDFLEWAEYHGNLYGTSRKFVEDNLAAGRNVILDIDVQGARQVKSAMSGAVTVFLMPPSFDELERRLRSRRLEDEETIRKRLAIAKSEISCYRDYDHVVVNDKLDEAIPQLDAIVRAGAAPPPGEADRIHQIIATFGGLD